MKKRKISYRKYIYVIFFIIVILSVSQFVEEIIKGNKYGYVKVDKKYENRYDYMLNKNYIDNIHKIFSIGRNDKGWIYSYKYKNKIRFSIWELENCENLEVSDFNMSINLPYREEDGSHGNRTGFNPRVCFSFITFINLSEKPKLVLKGNTLTNKVVNNFAFQEKINEIAFVDNQDVLQLKYTYENEEIVTKFFILKKGNSMFFIFMNPIAMDSFIFNPVELFDKEVLSKDFEYFEKDIK